MVSPDPGYSLWTSFCHLRAGGDPVIAKRYESPPLRMTVKVTFYEFIS
jgi:hypothetical protein